MATLLKTEPHGIEPVDLRILVLPDPVKERTSGGIILADVTKEADKWATTRGVLIAAGAGAWAEAKMIRPDFVPPSPGQRIAFAKYGKRAEIEGADGVTYWIMNDEDVVAVLES